MEIYAELSQKQEEKYKYGKLLLTFPDDVNVIIKKRALFLEFDESLFDDVVDILDSNMINWQKN